MSTTISTTINDTFYSFSTSEDTIYDGTEFYPLATYDATSSTLQLVNEPNNEMIEIKSIDNDWDLILIYSSLIGTIFALVVVTILFTHIARFFYKLFYKEKNKTQRKNVYILALTYYSSVILNILVFGFIYTNFFTGIDAEDFTFLHCTIGWTIWTVLAYTSLAILYIIFLSRIQQAFKGSVYAYNKCMSCNYKI